ncbi:hypothetical protein OJAV_G00020130 [Oryzias javanicus]|uniref:Centromere protein Q n=1 Tax=Oryzias javanicus TaxID=123683 RepID=A0A3S2MTX2_ORYJA|nr:hypothetical protein OJAV_G00020130 [Oryzias javanicus]
MTSRKLKFLHVSPVVTSLHLLTLLLLNCSQIATKQKKEIKALRELLKDTCGCHDHLAQQLQAIGKQLENSLNTLQPLLRRTDELEELREKDWKIQVRWRTKRRRKNIKWNDASVTELIHAHLPAESRSSFKSRLLAEKEKPDQVRAESADLQERVDQLTRDLKSCDTPVDDSILTENPQEEINPTDLQEKLQEGKALVQITSKTPTHVMKLLRTSLVKEQL